MCACKGWWLQNAVLQFASESERDACMGRYVSVRANVLASVRGESEHACIGTFSHTWVGTCVREHERDSGRAASNGTYTIFVSQLVYNILGAH